MHGFKIQVVLLYLINIYNFESKNLSMSPLEKSFLCSNLTLNVSKKFFQAYKRQKRSNIHLKVTRKINIHFKIKNNQWFPPGKLFFKNISIFQQFKSYAFKHGFKKQITDIIPNTTLRDLKLPYRITITSWFLKYNEVVSLREIDVNKPNTRLRLSNRNIKV